MLWIVFWHSNQNEKPAPNAQRYIHGTVSMLFYNKIVNKLERAFNPFIQKDPILLFLVLRSTVNHEICNDDDSILQEMIDS